jgi:predicted acyl esterase
MDCLHLIEWAGVRGGRFVAIQKLDKDGNIVPFTFYAQYLDGPVALGWLRASHRELDEEHTTEFQPVLAHRRELKLAGGEVTGLDIEIWPSGTAFAAGETLRVVVQGTDIYRYPKDIFANHTDTVNQGAHVIHAGGKYDSYLLVPVVSQR